MVSLPLLPPEGAGSGVGAGSGTAPYAASKARDPAATSSAVTV